MGAFDQLGRNNQLWVIYPSNEIAFSAPLSRLPCSMQEQLSFTNMEFYQRDGILYLIGGHGHRSTASDHITFPNVYAIDIDGAIQAVIQSGNLQSLIR